MVWLETALLTCCPKPQWVAGVGFVIVLAIKFMAIMQKKVRFSGFFCDSVLCATTISRLCLVLLVSVMLSCLWILWLLSTFVEFCRCQIYGDVSMLFEYLSQSLWLTSDCFGILVIRMINIGLFGLERVGVACWLVAGSSWFLDYSVLTVGSYTK